MLILLGEVGDHVVQVVDEEHKLDHVIILPEFKLETFIVIEMIMSLYLIAIVLEQNQLILQDVLRIVLEVLLNLVILKLVVFEICEVLVLQQHYDVIIVKEQIQHVDDLLLQVG